MQACHPNGDDGLESMVKENHSSVAQRSSLDRTRASRERVHMRGKTRDRVQQLEINTVSIYFIQVKNSAQADIGVLHHGRSRAYNGRSLCECIANTRAEVAEDVKIAVVGRQGLRLPPAP